jgi:hypothetical protein
VATDLTLTTPLGTEAKSAEFIRSAAPDLTLTTPLGQKPGPPDLATWYQGEMDALIPRFEAASKAAQESITARGAELRGLRERAATAPGLPESPELPEAPAAPKITSRPFLAGMPGEDPVQSLNKAMAGFGLMAQMAVGIKGGFPSGALAAYTGALEGWQKGDQRRAANQWQTYMGELKQHDNDVQAIRLKYEDAIRKWGADQNRLKEEFGIIAAEHGVAREGIELGFKDPQRAYEMVGQTARLLSDMQSSAANLALKNAMWYADRELKLQDFAQKERFHADKLKADAAKERGPKLSDESTMRQQFLGQSKDFITVRDAYARLQEAAAKPSAAGDLAMIFNYMKMLDPNSVVRETEFANAQNAAGIPERLRAQWNRALQGERLTEVTRADFLNQAGGQFAAQQAGQKQLEEQFRGVATRAGMDPAQIVVEFGRPVAAPGKPTAPAAPSPGWGPFQVLP